MERKRKTEIRPETPFPITDCYFPGHIFPDIKGAQLRPTGRLRSFYDVGRKRLLRNPLRFFLLLVIDIINKSFRIYNFLHEFREGLPW